MKVTVIPIVVGALGTLSKGLEKGFEIRGRKKTREITALLRWARILRKVLDGFHSSFSPFNNPLVTVPKAPITIGHLDHLKDRLLMSV